MNASVENLLFQKFGISIDTLPSLAVVIPAYLAGRMDGDKIANDPEWGISRGENRVAPNK